MTYLLLIALLLLVSEKESPLEISSRVNQIIEVVRATQMESKSDTWLIDLILKVCNLRSFVVAAAALVAAVMVGGSAVAAYIAAAVIVVAAVAAVNDR